MLHLLAYCGGLKTIDQAVRIFRSEIKKICLQSLCFENLSIVRELVDNFGNRGIVVSVDVKRTLFQGTSFVLLFNKQRNEKQSHSIIFGRVDGSGCRHNPWFRGQGWYLVRPGY